MYPSFWCEITHVTQRKPYFVKTFTYYIKCDKLCLRDGSMHAIYRALSTKKMKLKKASLSRNASGTTSWGASFEYGGSQILSIE